jgi:WD40 repeat protein
MVAVTEKSLLGFDHEKPAETIRPAPGIRLGSNASLSPDGRLFVTISDGDLKLHIWNPRTGILLTNLPDRRVMYAAFSPDGRWLACATQDATTFRTTEDWSPRHRIPTSLEAPGRFHLAFSDDGRLVAVSVSDSEIRLLVIETGEELATLPTERSMTRIAFSPGGDRLMAVFEAGWFHGSDPKNTSPLRVALRK